MILWRLWVRFNAWLDKKDAENKAEIFRLLLEQAAYDLIESERLGEFRNDIAPAIRYRASEIKAGRPYKGDGVYGGK